MQTHNDYWPANHNSRQYKYLICGNEEITKNDNVQQNYCRPKNKSRWPTFSRSPITTFHFQKPPSTYNIIPNSTRHQTSVKVNDQSLQTVVKRNFPLSLVQCTLHFTVYVSHTEKSASNHNTTIENMHIFTNAVSILSKNDCHKLDFQRQIASIKGLSYWRMEIR